LLYSRSDAPIVKWRRSRQRRELFVYDPIGAGAVGAARFLPELLKRLERELATEGLAVWEAFSSFCAEEIGIGPHRLLQASCEPVLKDIGWFEELCERLELESYQPAVEENREYMSAHWKRLLERG
jgi:hypothetical protein